MSSSRTESSPRPSPASVFSFPNPVPAGSRPAAAPEPFTPAWLIYCPIKDIGLLNSVLAKIFGTSNERAVKTPDAYCRPRSMIWSLRFRLSDGQLRESPVPKADSRCHHRNPGMQTDAISPKSSSRPCFPRPSQSFAKLAAASCICVLRRAAHRRNRPRLSRVWPAEMKTGEGKNAGCRGTTAISNALAPGAGIMSIPSTTTCPSATPNGDAEQICASRARTSAASSSTISTTYNAAQPTLRYHLACSRVRLRLPKQHEVRARRSGQRGHYYCIVGKWTPSYR